MIASMHARLFYSLTCLWFISGTLPAQPKQGPLVEAPTGVTPTEKPAAPVVKPQDALNPTVPEVTKPAPTEEELRAQKEAEIKAQKERELAAEKARADEARRIEEAKTFFDKLLENSKIYTGLNGGLGVSLNSTHKTGYGFGMTVDYLAYRRYGFHFGVETGIYPTKTQTLAAAPTPITVVEGGTFGYLNLIFAAVYALPAIINLEPAVGLGLAVYQLRGGTYDFNQTVAPFAYASIYYNLLGHLQVGLLMNMVLPASSKVISANSQYVLDSNAAQTTLGLHLSVRYSWF